MKRSKKQDQQRRAKRSARAAGAFGGGTSIYARKIAGEIPRQYRIEGGLLLSGEYLYEMPHPYIITPKIVLETVVEKRGAA